MPIDVIEPKIFEDQTQCNAFFTLKNAGIIHADASINGLNLGFNTGELPEVIKKNREKLLSEFGINPDWIAFANQVHSNRVKVVTEGGTFAETDGLITQVPGLALAIQVADCAAVILADPKSNTIAAMHAGWRGAAGDIVPRTIGKMEKLGASPKDFRAFVSPCISQEQFEVGTEVADQFPDEFVDTATYAKPHIDLKGFLQRQLLEMGLSELNIEVHQDCTITAAADYYSYRREKDKSGRMMAVIEMREG